MAEKFCGECGTPLSEAPVALVEALSPGRAEGPPPASRSGLTGPEAPTAERRLVSVLFADLVGFTPFAEERDSEEVRETLTRYFDVATEVITRYGGIVEKFIGDAVMAVWGTPVAREDDAERCVRAALELVGAVHVLGSGIQARAGVLTGEAAVTLGATNQGMVAGDIVNTAARLQSAAAPGTVLVGEATQRAAASAITFEPAGEQSLKGKAAPVPAFRALRVVAERGGRGRSDALEAPFVGRDDELRLIKDLFHSTAREGRTRLVSITGIGGIGKSRLAWEFEKYLDGIVGKVWWHRGRSPAYGEGMTFWALGEMVRGRAGLAEADDEATTRARIADLLDRLALDEKDRRWVEPAVLALLGIGAGIGAEQLFGAWRTLFERLAASAPVVLVFEDLHWADAGTLDFIDHLLEWSRSIPLCIITLARPELLDKRPEWGSGRRNFTSLYLEPLPGPVMRELLAGLVPGLPEPAVAAVIGRAEGIPLYAVETVRMLVADGKVVAAGDGTYRPVGDLSSLAIPETLTALIAARLDALDPADRSLVMDAAVLGQSFTVAGLAAIAGIDEAEFEPRLRTLVRRELFAHMTDPTSPERGQYAFVQALIREVAYNTLARKDRKVRHLAAARHFESLGNDELAGGLAGHYLAARDNAAEGAEADALGTQARIALRGAAERAASLGGFDQALTFFEQALGVANDPGDRAELSQRAGEVASTAGRHDASERHLRAAVELHREREDRLATARAVAGLGRALNMAYRIEDAIALLEPAATEFMDLAPDVGVVAIGGQLARAHFLLEHHRQAIEVADLVLLAAEQADIKALVADTLVTKGTALAMAGRPIEGLGVLRAGMELAEAAGLIETVLRAANNRAVYENPRDPREGLANTLNALGLARQLGARVWIAPLVQAVGETSVRTGDWDAAITELDAALADEWEAPERASLLGAAIVIAANRGQPFAERLGELERLTDSMPHGSAIHAVLPYAAGYAALAQGRLGEARVLLHQCADLYSANLPICAPASAHAALWDPDAAGAREDLAALDDAGLHGPSVESDRLSIRAGIAALEGRTTDALALYREALSAERELGLAWDEALTVIDMVTLLDPDLPEVVAATAAAREILVRLGATPFIERLDVAIAEGRGDPEPGSRAGLATTTPA